MIAAMQCSARVPSLALCGKGGLEKKLVIFWRNRLDWGISGEFYYYEFR